MLFKDFLRCVYSLQHYKCCFILQSTVLTTMFQLKGGEGLLRHSESTAHVI